MTDQAIQLWYWRAVASAEAKAGKARRAWLALLRSVWEE